MGAVALIADQLSKWVVRSALVLGERTQVLGQVGFERVDNHGIAFSLFPGRQGAVAVITFLAMIGIATLLATVGRRDALVVWGGGALMGGSVGNLVDRITRGAVTDFIALPHWPRFNLADVAITIGAGLIAIGLWRMEEKTDGP